MNLVPKLTSWLPHLGVLLAWQLLSQIVAPQFLPSPGAVGRAFVATTLSGELPRHLGQSAVVLLAGFGLAAVCGMATGIAMGLFATVRRFLDPYISAFYATPTVALIPLVIIWLGLGFPAKVFLTALVAVFPIVINAEIGVATVPPEFIETARAFGCNRRQIFSRVVLPAAVPIFAAGLRLGLGRALVGVVVAEMFTALTGLGYLIVLYGNTFRTAELFVPLLSLALISIILMKLLRRLELRVAPWQIVKK